jgi:hypothetical protein
MLIRQEPQHRLVNYLWHVETEYMGLFGDRKRIEAVADRLTALQEEIKADT